MVIARTAEMPEAAPARTAVVAEAEVVGRIDVVEAEAVGSVDVAEVEAVENEAVGHQRLCAKAEEPGYSPFFVEGSFVPAPLSGVALS